MRRGPTSRASWAPARRTTTPAAAEACPSERGQALQRECEGLVALGEAETRDALLEAARVERRQRDRRHAGLGGQAAAERLLRLVADRRVVHALEVAAFAGHQLESAAREAGTEPVALALVEAGQAEVVRGPGHEGRQPVLHRRVDGEP